jgi:hypothetical protein
MTTERKSICPLMQRTCIEDGSIINGELCTCRFWVHLAGKNPQTGAVIDDANCAYSWIPILLIENSQQQRATGAAVESFRNEMVRAQSGSIALLASMSGLPIIENKNG